MVFQRRRNSLRAPGHDYRSANGYFVTLCSSDRRPVLGYVAGHVAHFSDLGLLVREEWLATARLRPYVALDEFIIMPDHLHGILWITREQELPSSELSASRLRPGSLGAIVGQFKSRVTRRAVEVGLWNPGKPLWQRGFHDRMVRTDCALGRMRWYIQTNPLRWPPDPTVERVIP
jgi:REP-associated tyrosine transposase